MRPFSSWHLTILCTLLITLFVFWTFFYVYNNEDRNIRSLEYDTVWSATNGRTEFYKFSNSLTRFLYSRTQSDLDDARIKFEILLGRIDTWNSGSFKDFLNETPELIPVFSALRADLDYLARALFPSSQETPEEVLPVLARASKKIDLISGTSYQSSIERFAGERQKFRERLMNEKRIVMGLLVLAMCLLAIVMRQNLILSRANEKIAGVANQLAHMAKHDALTALPNRTLLDEYLNQARREMTLNEMVLAVALDLDGFKAINDTLGHAGGDALLVSLARKLQKTADSLPGRNLVARVGGDEFFLLSWGQKNRLRIDETVARLAGIFEVPLETSIGSLLVGASIGYAVAEGTRELDFVTLNADLALTEAKARGRGTSIRFASQMRSQLERRLQIERELPVALQRRTIQPNYQLQYNLVTGQPVGVEALARWFHEEIGQVSPNEFIPIAEASGDVIELGQFMLKTACRDVQRLPGHIRVAVNLSMVQLLNDDVFDLVETTLRETGLPPRRLKLEVTESIFMHNVETVSSVLTNMQNLGVAISLDDFGTGYSALGYLNNFKWDELKIDRSFVNACEVSSKALNIVSVIQSLAEKMNANLLVEGLETSEQVTIFRNLGCRYGQGFHYSRAMPIEDVCAWFSRNGDRAGVKADIGSAAGL
ncbi:putative bifunctional diguanylate cyclase/phosphodiesterase [Roseibium sp.]|uniref:putative bifunctional diguanylate cyclase/phosphodiesterase n=1 Tax=Roseibium sp. TaxID=1936156 RepID=UPI003D14DACC